MFSDPKKNIDQCGIQVGMSIADLGAGSGHYSLEAGKSLMSTGRVYAIDVHEDMLVRLKNNATRSGLYNVEIILGDMEREKGTKLKEATVDLALACNIFFQIEKKKDMVLEIQRILKPGGRVLVVDWTDSFGGIGPEKTQVFSKKDCIKLFQGPFHLDREIEAGSHHYGLLFKKL